MVKIPQLPNNPTPEDVNRAVTEMFNRAMQWLKCPACSAVFASNDAICPDCGTTGEPHTVEVRVQ